MKAAGRWHFKCHNLFIQTSQSFQCAGVIQSEHSTSPSKWLLCLTYRPPFTHSWLLTLDLQFPNWRIFMFRLFSFAKHLLVNTAWSFCKGRSWLEVLPFWCVVSTCSHLKNLLITWPTYMQWPMSKCCDSHPWRWIFHCSGPQTFLCHGPVVASPCGSPTIFSLLLNCQF